MSRDPSVQPEAGDVRLDALRRRLYRAGATEDDVQRYVAEQAARPAEQPVPAVGHEGSARSRRRLHRAGWTVAAALTATVAVVALVQQTRAPAPIGPSPTAVPEAVALRDVGEGEVLDLRRGSASRAVAVAASVRGVATVGQRFGGRGNAVVRFAPPAGATRGGRAQVTLLAGGPAPVRWRALLLVEQVDRSSSALVMARGVSDGRAGPGEPVTFVYANRPPTEVAVMAPEGIPWTLEVAATDGIEPVLR